MPKMTNKVHSLLTKKQDFGYIPGFAHFDASECNLIRIPNLVINEHIFESNFSIIMWELR